MASASRPAMRSSPSWCVSCFGTAPTATSSSTTPQTETQLAAAVAPFTLEQTAQLAVVYLDTFSKICGSIPQNLRLRWACATLRRHRLTTKGAFPPEAQIWPAEPVTVG